MNMTPTVGPDNVLYVAGWTAGADASDKIEVPPFDEMLKLHDKNQANFLFEVVKKGARLQRFPFRYPLSCIVALRATCAIQLESGWRVMPPNDTRRLPTTMKNST